MMPWFLCLWTFLRDVQEILAYGITERPVNMESPSPRVLVGRIIQLE